MAAITRVVVEVEGLRMRSALLPGGAVGGSRHHLETVGVLGALAVLGPAAAPVVLRPMARSGKALQRVG